MSSNMYQFPWCLQVLDLNSYELFRVIEIFVRSMSLSGLNDNSNGIFSSSDNNIIKGDQACEISSLYLSREMAKHISRCEERILESLVWQNNSQIWSHLALVKLNKFGNQEEQLPTSLANYCFPLYEDVVASTSCYQYSRADSSDSKVCGPTLTSTTVNTSSTQQVNSNTSSNNGTTTINGSLNELIINLTPNPSASSASANAYLSPIKHPTITKVVATSGPSSSSNEIASRNISQLLAASIITNGNQLTTTPSPNKLLASALSKQPRLSHISSSLRHLMRKFYLLANTRLIEIVEKLDLASHLLASKSTNGSHAYKESSVSLPSSTLNSNSYPIITPVASASSSVNSNNSSIITPISGSQQANHISEKHNLLLRKTWSIFEYAMCNSYESTDSIRVNLICDRHLDQLLMCSLYIGCKLCSLNLQFYDIMRVYRLLASSSSNVVNNSNSVYRSVLLGRSEDKDDGKEFHNKGKNNPCETRGDLIQFYNELFVKRLKLYVKKLTLAEANASVTTTPNSKRSLLVDLSPMPKSHPSSTSVSCSPRALTNSVHISPSKTMQHSNVSIQQRNKITLRMSDPYPYKTIQAINEMVKKNEMKIKSSNRRLFSDSGTSSHSVPVSLMTRAIKIPIFSSANDSTT
jgi:hypothetical protein